MDGEQGINSQPNLSSYLAFELSLSNFYSTTFIASFILVFLVLKGLGAGPFIFTTNYMSTLTYISIFLYQASYYVALGQGVTRPLCCMIYFINIMLFAKARVT